MKTFSDAKADFEYKYATDALKKAKGNVSEAARIAGKDRKDFYALMDRCGIGYGDHR